MRQHNKIVQKEKPGVIGHFVSNKAMVFDKDIHSLIPEADKDEPKKLIDYSVMKKGLKAASRKTKKQEDVLESLY